MGNLIRNFADLMAGRSTQKANALITNYQNGLTAAERTIIARSGAAILPPVANNFDPHVTGLVAPIGARVSTIDGTKSWDKTGNANTAWTPLTTIGVTLLPPVANDFDPVLNGLVAPVGARVSTLDGTKTWDKTNGSPGGWTPLSAIGAIIRPPVANDYDPYTSGLAAPVGALVRTLDGTKSWLKYGTADTSWRAIHRVESSVTMSGGPGTYLQADIAIPSHWSVRAYFRGQSAIDNKWFGIRINNATPITKAMAAAPEGTFEPLGKLWLGFVANDGGADITIGPSNNGWRTFQATGFTAGGFNGRPGVWSTGILAADAITRVGFTSIDSSAAVPNGSTVNVIGYRGDV